MTKHILDMSQAEAHGEILFTLERLSEHVIKSPKRIIFDSETAKRFIDLIKRAETKDFPKPQGDPEQHRCDKFGNLLAWEINKKQWVVVTYTFYMYYKVCYKRWMYLPGDPE